MVNSPGRSSGSWFTLLPAPSHPIDRTVVFAGFVPIYSGGTARDLHPLPLPGVTMCGHNRRERQNLSSSIMSDSGTPTTFQTHPEPCVTQNSLSNKGFWSTHSAQSLLSLRGNGSISQRRPNRPSATKNKEVISRNQ